MAFCFPILRSSLVPCFLVYISLVVLFLLSQSRAATAGLVVASSFISATEAHACSSVRCKRRNPSIPILHIQTPQTSSSSSPSSCSCFTTTFCFLAGISSSPSSSPCSSSSSPSSVLSSSRALFLPLLPFPLPFAAAVATLAFLPPVFLVAVVMVPAAEEEEEEEDSFLIWSLTARRVGASPRVEVANRSPCC